MTSTRFIAIGYLCRDMLELFGTPSFQLSPVQFIMTYSRHAQFYAATVVSINRMTAVLFPTNYNKIWETHWVKFLTLMLILPLFTSWYLLPTQSYLRSYSLGGLTIAYNKIIPNALIPLYMSINFGVMSQEHFFIAICIKQIVIDIRKAKGSDNVAKSPSLRRNSLKTICVKNKNQLERSRSLQDHGPAPYI
ncbi:hypothetical protein ANCCEY_03320 [Ancylostoma ceylanicum]|uniref:Serpentine receptor class gamma n=1 Tax=Ancylostoma ceylanicum TaxID=53326 RepID=A0A0D6MBA8_9BILA|nr:hypothetical protein ANCCEY_03320 [Ancylostoma ceylanicum]